MLSALPNQDLFLNSIEMLLDMDAPESPPYGAVVFGADIKQRQVRLSPQSLASQDVGEDGAAVYDDYLLSVMSVVRVNLPPPIKILPQIQDFAITGHVTADKYVPASTISFNHDDLCPRASLRFVSVVVEFHDVETGSARVRDHGDARSTLLELRLTSITENHAKLARTPVPFRGWALELAISLDRACPGLLAATFRFGARRRQALFLVLAAVQEHGLDEIGRRLRDPELAAEFRDLEDAALLGRAVVHLRRPRDLLLEVFGSLHDGLLGALARLGPDPLDEPDLYRELHRLFASAAPGDRRRAKLLGQIEGELVGAQIAVVSLLDPLLLHPALVSKIHDVEHVAEVHHALAYIRTYCSGATDAGIRTSLGLLRQENSRVDFVRAWASRFDKLPYALDTSGDPTLTVLASAAAMRDAARRFKNCLKTRISDVLLGTHLFVEYRPTEERQPGVIVELRRIEQGFFLENLYGVGNTRVRADRANLVRRKLAACGVALLDHAPASPEMMHAVAGMLGAWPLGVPDNNQWIEETIDADDDLHSVLDEAA